MTVQVGTMVGCIGSGDFGITTILKDQPAQRTTLLVVLDGFGHRDAIEHNAISAARTPNWDRFLATRPHTLISASGADVGLPGGQMGNSEVGHMNLGAGRVVPQDLSRIDRAVELGELETNPALGGLFDKVLNAGGAVHVLGLLSPGGVHSHEAQIFELLRVAAGRGLKQIHLHAFLDGRDTPPKSAMASLEKAQGLLGELGVGRVGSITGRYYAMTETTAGNVRQAAIAHRGNGEIRARHLFLFGGPGGTLRGRRTHPGTKPEGRHLRPATRNERPPSYRPPHRRHSVPAA